MVGGITNSNPNVLLNTASNIGNEQVQGAGTPSQGVTNADLQGAPRNTGTASTHAFTMPAPKADAASLMLALSALQKNISDASMDSVTNSINGQKAEIDKLNAKRAEEVKKYFENMEKSIPPKKTGLFGLVFKFFKAVVMAPFVPKEETKAAFAELGEMAKNSVKDIIKDVLSVMAVVASIAIAVCTFGGGGPLAVATIALVIAASVASTAATMLSDPGIQDEILSGKSPEELAKSKKTMAIITYVLMGVSVACSIASVCTGYGAVKAVQQTQSALKDVIGAAKTAVETTASVAGKAANLQIIAEASIKFASTVHITSSAMNHGLKLLATIVNIGNAIYGGFVTGSNAIDARSAADAHATALDFAAESEKTMANIAQIEKELEVRMEILKELLAIQQKMLESTCSMLTKNTSGERAAASA